MLTRIRKAQNEDGFTLIELLVVIIIIGILAAIAIPAFLRQREKGYIAAEKSDIKSANTAMEALATENNGTYVAATDLSIAAGVNANSFLQPHGFRQSPDTTVMVRTRAANTAYCLKATSTRTTTITWFDSDSGRTETGATVPATVGAAANCPA